MRKFALALVGLLAAAQQTAAFIPAMPPTATPAACSRTGACVCACTYVREFGSVLTWCGGMYMVDLIALLLRVLIVSL